VVDDGRRASRLMSAARCRTIPCSPCSGEDMRTTKPLRPLDTERSYGFSRPVRWHCGTFFTHFGKFEIVCYQDGVEVSKLQPYPRPAAWVERFPLRRFPWRLLNGERTMASKWIKAAVARKAKSKPTALPADATLCTGRPALTDFMTDLEGPNGGVREPSALMVVCTTDGVRAGLKDDDAGGWCWREGSTLEKALDAIEQALQAGEGAFRGPRPSSKKKNK